MFIVINLKSNYKRMQRIFTYQASALSELNYRCGAKYRKKEGKQLLIRQKGMTQPRFELGTFSVLTAC